jgi:uncharacterized surface protein with fasciclin (FAS1) repeats
MKLNMKFKLIKHSLVVMAALLTFASCDNREQNVSYQPAFTESLFQIAEKESNLTIFTAAAKRVGLEQDLKVLGSYTVVAPTDAAFAAAGITAASVGTLPIDVLRAVLRNHMLSGRILSTDLAPGPNAVYITLQREVLNCSFYNNNYFLNAKRVNKTNIRSLNGILHTIDGVLMPPLNTLSATAAANPNLSFFVAAVNRAGLTAALNASTTLLTVFAPTNAAFIAAGFPDIAAIDAADPVTLGNILRYHVIPSSTLTNSSITSPYNRAGRAFSIDLTSNTYVTALGATPTVTVAVGGSGVTIRGASNTAASNVTAADILYFAGSPGANGVRPGVLHIIDRVLLP